MRAINTVFRLEASRKVTEVFQLQQERVWGNWQTGIHGSRAGKVSLIPARLAQGTQSVPRLRRKRRLERSRYIQQGIKSEFGGCPRLVRIYLEVVPFGVLFVLPSLSPSDALPFSRVEIS